MKGGKRQLSFCMCGVMINVFADSKSPFHPKKTGIPPDNSKYDG